MSYVVFRIQSADENFKPFLLNLAKVRNLVEQASELQSELPRGFLLPFRSQTDGHNHIHFCTKASPMLLSILALEMAESKQKFGLHPQTVLEDVGKILPMLL